MYTINRIDSNSVIKVADFGLSESVERKFYHQNPNSGIKLPLKWMAPESTCMQYGIFSEKSDIVRNLYYVYKVLWSLFKPAISLIAKHRQWGYCNNLAIFVRPSVTIPSSCAKF